MNTVSGELGSSSVDSTEHQEILSTTRMHNVQILVERKRFEEYANIELLHISEDRHKLPCLVHNTFIGLRTISGF